MKMNAEVSAVFDGAMCQEIADYNKDAAGRSLEVRRRCHHILFPWVPMAELWRSEREYLQDQTDLVLDRIHSVTN